MLVVNISYPIFLPITLFKIFDYHIYYIQQILYFIKTNFTFGHSPYLTIEIFQRICRLYLTPHFYWIGYIRQIIQYKLLFS